MKPFTLLLTLAPVICAQMMNNGASPQFTPPRAQPTFEELKTAVGLSDAQIADLQKFQQEKMSASSTYFSKVQEKRKELSQLLESPAPDAAKVGQTLIEMQQLQKQGQPAATDIHEKALGILSADQKQKLVKLEEALKQRPAVDQAVQLNLLVQAPKPTPAGPGSMVHPAAVAPTPPAKPATQN